MIAASGIVAGWLSLPLMAASSSSLDLAARSELRMRVPGDVTADQRTESNSWDYEIGATSNLLIDFRDTKIRVAYSPRVSLNDFTNQALRNIWQTAAIGISWIWPRVQLDLTENATYGDRYYSALTNQTGTDPITGGLVLQALPRSTSIRDASSDTALNLTYSLTRRTSLRLMAAQQFGGGIGEESSAVLPFFYATRSVAGIDYKLTRGDLLTTFVQALYTHTDAPVPPDVNVFVSSLWEVWLRQWSSNTTTGLGGGVSVIPPYLYHDQIRVSPLALATVNQRAVLGPSHGVLQLGAGGSIEVVVDRLTGIADTRGQVGANAGWQMRHWVFSGRLTHARSLDTSIPNAMALTAGEARVGWQLSRPILLESAVRILRQEQLTPGAIPLAANGFQWGALAVFSYHFDLIEL